MMAEGLAEGLRVFDYRITKSAVIAIFWQLLSRQPEGIAPKYMNLNGYQSVWTHLF
jgi:hypothetical protein